MTFLTKRDRNSQFTTKFNIHNNYRKSLSEFQNLLNTKNKILTKIHIMERWIRFGNNYKLKHNYNGNNSFTLLFVIANACIPRKKRKIFIETCQRSFVSSNFPPKNLKELSDVIENRTATGNWFPHLAIFWQEIQRIENVY